MQVPRGDGLARALLLVPAALAVLVFAGTLGGAFVYDDRDLIVQNPWVHDLDDLPSAFTRPMWSFRTSTPTNYYRPLPVAAYTLLWVAGGGSAWPFHLLSVLLHAGNVLLVTTLVLRLGQDRALAGAAGCLFAVHPLVSESVAWISGLPELMYTAAVLGFLHLHLRGRTVLAAAVLLAGLLSKETALVAVPLALILPGPKRRVLAYLVPVAVVLVLRFAVLGSLTPRTGGWEGLLLAPRLLAGYLGLLVAPVGLSAHHLLPGWTDPHVLLGLATAALLLAFGRSLPPVAVALCLLPLLPVLYVPALGVAPVAERYAYLPLAGFLWIALDPLRRRGSALLVPVTCVLVLVLGAATAVRAGVWKDERTLAESMLRADPRAQPAYLMLAKWHWDRGDKEAAIEVFERGMAQLPDDPELAASLVVARWSLGTAPPEEAIPALEALASERGADAMLQYNLGEAYLRTDRPEEAERSFARALAARPACPECLVGRAVAAARRGEARQSVEFARQALALAPGDVPALRQLGVSLLRQGDAAGAVQALEEASVRAPEDAEVWNALGAAYASGGRLSEAAQAWERAVALDPGQENARRNLERLRGLRRGPS